MPDIRPFRALRFDPSTVGDLASVIAPPYAAIDAAERDRLLARHPANVVRVDLPEDRSGDEPDDRYRRAARALAEWRSTSVLGKDPHPSVYVYERTAPGDAPQRGFFARLCLESLGPDGQIEPAAGADGGDAGDPDDRYRLMRATGINASPVIARYDDPSGTIAAALDEVARRPADVEVADDAGVRHRLWAQPADGDGGPAVEALTSPAAAGRLEIATGLAVYRAALRYRDERRMSRSCEEDPPFDYVLTLFVARSDPTPHPSAATGLVLNPHEW